MYDERTIFLVSVPLFFFFLYFFHVCLRGRESAGTVERKQEIKKWLCQICGHCKAGENADIAFYFNSSKTQFRCGLMCEQPMNRGGGVTYPALRTQRFAFVTEVRCHNGFPQFAGRDGCVDDANTLARRA